MAGDGGRCTCRQALLEERRADLILGQLIELIDQDTCRCELVLGHPKRSEEFREDETGGDFDADI